MVFDWLKEKKQEKHANLEARLAETSQPVVPQSHKLSDDYDTFKYLGILDTYGVD